VSVNSKQCLVIYKITANGTIYNAVFMGSGNASGIYWENNIRYDLDITGYGITIFAILIDK
jgi:hypothetical protein